MREIKFRGKEIYSGNGEWKYGFYEQGAFINPKNGGVKIRHLIYAEYLYDVDPETVCQFTGLRDEYGKDVYEGDIVIYDGSPEFGARIVVYYEQAFNIATQKEFEFLQRGSHPYFNDYAHMTCLSNWSDMGLVRVIGNIYDNPELLEQCNNPDEGKKKHIEDVDKFIKEAVEGE